MKASYVRLLQEAFAHYRSDADVDKFISVSGNILDNTKVQLHGLQ